MNYFSKSTRGFYTDEDHAGCMPEDVVMLTQEQYDAVKNASELGGYIEGDSNGYPVVRDVSQLPAETPQVVTMYQARAALLHAGRLDDVDAALDAMPDGLEKRQALLAWEFAWSVERGSPFVAMLASALGLDAAAIDELFQAAALVQ